MKNFANSRVGAVAIGASALVVMGGTGAYAASQISSHDIKDQTIQARDIHAGGVGNSELRDHAVSMGKLGTGVQDKLNQIGQKADQSSLDNEAKARQDADNGLQDQVKGTLKGPVADGPYQGNALGDNQPNSDTTVPAHTVKVVWTSCADGKVAVAGGYRYGLAAESFNDQQPHFDNLSVNASEPAYQKDGALENSYGSPAQVTENGGFRPNAWAVTVQNDSDQDQNVRAWVVCTASN